MDSKLVWEIIEYLLWLFGGFISFFTVVYGVGFLFSKKKMNS